MMCNILRQKCGFEVNDVSSGVGSLLGKTWVVLLQSLEKGQKEPWEDV